MDTSLPAGDVGDGPAMTIEPSVAIPLPDGSLLRADVYRPGGPGRVPAIATLGPYGKDVPLAECYPQLWPQLLGEHPDILSASSGRYLVWERPDPERWTAAGYAVVHIDAPGSGESPGVWSPMSLDQHGSGQGPASGLFGRRPAGDEVLPPAELECLRDDVPALTRSHPLFDDWAAAQAVDWSRVAVPFLSVGSLATVGLHLRGNVEAFRHAASPHKWLMLLAARGTGLDRFYGDAGFAVQRKFLDHFLKDEDNDWPAQPRVSYEMQERGGTIAVGTAGTWPPERARFMRFSIDCSHRSMSRAAPREAATATFWPTSDGLSLAGEPFRDGAEIAGPVSLHLRISTEARDVDVFAYLSVVDADGAITGRVAQGWLRLSHRELDSGASSPGHPVLAHRRLSEVQPGCPYAVDLEMWPASARVPPGGSLLLVLRGIDADDIGQFRHNDPDDRPGSVFAGWTTLHSGPDRPSLLMIPVCDRTQPRPPERSQWTGNAGDNQEGAVP